MHVSARRSALDKHSVFVGRNAATESLKKSVLIHFEACAWMLLETFISRDPGVMVLMYDSTDCDTIARCEMSTEKLEL